MKFPWTPLFSLALGALPATSLAEVSMGAYDMDAAGARFVDGNEAFRRGAWEEALAHYLKAYALAPDKPQVSFNLATTLFQLDDCPQALSWLDVYSEWATDTSDTAAVIAMREYCSKHSPVAIVRMGVAEWASSAGLDSLQIDGMEVGAPFLNRKWVLQPGAHRITALRVDCSSSGEIRVDPERVARFSLNPVCPTSHLTLGIAGASGLAFAMGAYFDWRAGAQSGQTFSSESEMDARRKTYNETRAYAGLGYGLGVIGVAAATWLWFHGASGDAGRSAQ